MAATAYAAVVSLLNTMDQIQIHPLLSTYFNNNYSIQSLRENVDFFADFLEEYSFVDSRKAEDLLSRIADVAHEAEELMNVEAAHHRIRDGSIIEWLRTTWKLKKITKEMDCVKKNVMKVKRKTGFIRQALNEMLPKLQRKVEDKAEEMLRRVFPNMHHIFSESSSTAPPATAVVGFDGYVEQLLDELTGHHSGRQILPIVGMGGIGKTTLATHVYHKSLKSHNFDVCAWITLSQKFSARNIILQALSCLGGYTSSTDTFKSNSDDELGEELRRILYDRRYLIILDDMWSVEAWEEIKKYLPDNNNRSRIVVTTRESKLVDYFGSSALFVDFLDEKNSWELFYKKTFAQKGYPYLELEEIGKKIVEKCEGLPLAITVFGGLLQKSPKKREYWEKIAKDKSLILNSGHLSVLYLSYKYLPVWLKPCFLYLGLHPENHEIDVSKLIKFWVAEGFIRSKEGESLEETAESYRKELVDRNLFLVGELRLTINKKLRSCRVHDVVRDLCIRIAKEEKYFLLQRDINEERHEHKSRLLRVSVYDKLDYSSQVINLRFISNAINFMSLSISRFWSLQTLILDQSSESIYAPCEIWKMPQLRHIKIYDSFSLPDPPSPTSEDGLIVLQNLKTLTRVHNLVLSEEVCKRMPNIKELGIAYRFNEASTCYHLHNLSCFNKLESLELCLSEGRDLLQNVKLPSSLKELSLSGSEWNFSAEEEFRELKHLYIHNCDDMISWNADSSSFPKLKILSLSHLSKLEEIPSDIGYIPTLERMDIQQCSESVIMSAIEILKEQISVGNESLQLTLHFYHKVDAEKWRGEIEEMAIKLQNLHIDCLW